MIGKITIGKSFRGCLLYCLNDKRQQNELEQVMKDRAEILMFNQCYGNQKEIIQQFEEVRRLNPKLSKPVLHITLSLVPGEKLSKDKLMEMCQDCARDMKFENNQYVAIHHLDTNHQHIHIVANRVGFDKRTVSDSQSYQRIASYCRKMELKHVLRQVLNPKLYLSKEQRLIPRFDLRKEGMKKDIRQALRESLKYDQFETRMKETGYLVIKGRGISFIDKKKVKVKGSELGFSLQTIEQILEAKQVVELKGSIQKEQIQKQKVNYRQEQHPKQKQQNTQVNNEYSKEYSLSEGRHLSKNVLQLLEKLIEPEQIDQELPYELSQQAYERRERQRHRHR